MMVRNSFRLFLANFGTFWKDFLFKVIIVAIVFALSIPVLYVFSNTLTSVNLQTQLEQFLLMFPFTDIASYINASFGIFNLVLQFLSELFSNYLWQSIYLVFLYGILLPFLMGLSHLAVSEMLYGYMATNTKYNFGASLIKKLGKSIIFSFFNILIKIFSIVLVLSATYGILYLASQNIISIVITPFLLILTLVLILAFINTVFSGWAPSIIVFSSGVFFGLGKGFKAVGRRFFKTFSSLGMMFLLCIMLVSVFGVLSLVLVLPMFKLWLNAFSMIMFFGSQGMRYYVDPDTILSPKKLEETDKFENTKFVI